MRLIKVAFLLFILIVISFIASQTSSQENENKVRLSPKAEVMQTVGLTDVTISYSRPGVKGRTIWGALVPYDKVWRSGANEATKFTFSKNVVIEGKKLNAGSYSFFTIPAKNDWTLIFNKVADQWGHFEYNEAEDAIRIKVKPKNNEFQEWLAYTFSDMTVNTEVKQNSAIVNLVWEKLKIPFKIEEQ